MLVDVFQNSCYIGYVILNLRQFEYQVDTGFKSLQARLAKELEVNYTEIKLIPKTQNYFFDPVFCRQAYLDQDSLDTPSLIRLTGF